MDGGWQVCHHTSWPYALTISHACLMVYHSQVYVPKFHLWKFLGGKNCGREYIRWSIINLTLPIATKKASRPAKKATKAARPAKKAAKPAKKAARPAKKATKAKRGGKRKWGPQGLNIIVDVPLVFHKQNF